MFPSAAVLSLITILSILFNTYNTTIALPFAILWLISPIVAFKISQPDDKPIYKAPDEDIELIRKIAIKTWKFYEDIFNEENNYLPVDNIQEVPTNKVAHRTSPTNIGFLILSMCSAVDLGYISLKKFAYMLDKTMSTLEKLDKWNGHLYNWYDTRTLQVLHPKYVSTVDSGNLVAYLMVASSSIEEFLNKNPMSFDFYNGLKDILYYYDYNSEISEDLDIFTLLNELNKNVKEKIYYPL
ncbi:hypothetical protein PL321_14185 [Caloramator sp. mosi_1]|uniref:hypothetical protein n=1 Tax=Caloramator sp. mosi_1 TaxID=3023090 RepID=UPI0023604F70|nr:hypothetical protein [Caloramator sp. mosi_1]WDC83707.1 hypothetical protein PL321_14185 [Caloramator sp. mosi_1]